jgi:glycosyltransferase involved in cell wall biosynthesis
MTWHIVTGEYPPTIGGVADHSRLLARELAARGADVHVWCPGRQGGSVEDRVAVHRVAGTWSRRDCSRVEPLVREVPGTMLLQWVPHAYGRKSLNLQFCLWVRGIARRGLRVEVLVHEPFLAFGEGSWKQEVAAAVHRAMVVALFQAASRIWVTIPAWEERIRPWLLGRAVPVAWLPVPSNICPVDAPAEVARIRARALGSAPLLVGHFGTFGRATDEPLLGALARVLRTGSDVAVLLIGRDGEAFRARLCAREPGGAARVHATGALDEQGVSRALQACDVMIQPYIDGASSRRGTLMAALGHGLPTVTTTGRLSEPLWAHEHGRSIITVPAGDYEGLGDAVLSLGRDPAQRARVGRAARALYDEHFTIELMATRLLDVRRAL